MEHGFKSRPLDWFFNDEDTKFIRLTRDPIDQLMSSRAMFDGKFWEHYSDHYMKSDSPEDEVSLYQAREQWIENDLAEIPDDQIFRLTYDELNFCTGIPGRLIDFLKLSQHDSVQEYQKLHTQMDSVTKYNRPNHTQRHFSCDKRIAAWKRALSYD